ncbi:MAG: SCO1664 family protein [Actinobacteria bacterium]|nr:SCO1664 family protein [Actinomycetota bacterium]
MKITGRLVDASNATMLATIEDGADGIKVIYKPVAGERPLWDFPHGTLADREYAAYLLSSLGGFHVVPFTVLREGPFGPGAVQQWIEIDPEVDLIEFFQKKLSALRKMALFDAVINNTDRKIGHILPTREGLVYGCDHGVTFHEEDKLRTVLWQWAGKSLHDEERELLGIVSRALDSELGDALGVLLIESEINALKRRTNRLLENNLFPEPTQDWPSVPWPPF